MTSVSGAATHQTFFFSALHEAARNGHPEVVKLLLEAGAHKDVKDSETRLPLDLARSHGHREVAYILQPKPQTRKRQKLAR